MKKIVLVCGLTAGAIEAAMLAITTGICYKTGTFSGSMLLGYATMLLAFSLIFIGIKHYRDKYQNGSISFGRAFKTGLLISLVASTIYVLVWLVCFYFFIPDFMDRYVAYTMNQARTNGMSAAELGRQASQMEMYKQMYKSPVMVVLLTYMEILPVGLIISLIAALILKRKQKQPSMAMA